MKLRLHLNLFGALDTRNILAHELNSSYNVTGKLFGIQFPRHGIQTRLSLLRKRIHSTPNPAREWHMHDTPPPPNKGDFLIQEPQEPHMVFNSLASLCMFFLHHIWDMNGIGLDFPCLPNLNPTHTPKPWSRQEADVWATKSRRCILSDWDWSGAPGVENMHGTHSDDQCCQNSTPEVPPSIARQHTAASKCAKIWEPLLNQRELRLR